MCNNNKPAEQNRNHSPHCFKERERETALIGQNSDLDGVEGKESVVREVVRGELRG